MPKLLLRSLILAASLVLPATVAHAGQLQISPTSLQIDLRQAQGGFTVLRNAGTTPSVYRVSVLRWTQPAPDTAAASSPALPEADAFASTRDLVINPLQFTLQPGQEQTVRVVVRSRPGQPEQAYRLMINEEPVGNPAQTGSQVSTLLRVSLPVFVRTQDVAPALSWQLQQRGNDARLTVRNSGTGRALLLNGTVQPAQATAAFSAVQLGSVNVLAGGEMSWNLPAWGQLTGGATIGFGGADGKVLEVRAELER